MENILLFQITMASYIIYFNGTLGAVMPSFRICSNCFGSQVYPYMGFMTGERYQCQECEEILVMPIEFDNTDDYLQFLKVQSPEKFAQIEGDLKEVQKEVDVPKPITEDEDLELVSNSGKLSHICIFEDCQKGKRSGTDYCRKHWRDGHDVEF